MRNRWHVTGVTVKTRSGCGQKSDLLLPVCDLRPSMGMFLLLLVTFYI